MPGFDNGVMYADNVDFRGLSPVVGQITTDGQLLIGSTASPHIKAGNIVAGAGATVTNGSGSITIGLAGPMGFSWNTVTSAGNPNAMSTFNAYITGGALLTTVTLPAAANTGDIVVVTGYTSLFQILQNAGQSIIFSNQSTTVGATGTLTSTTTTDHVTLVCITLNTVWKVIDSQGNLIFA